MHLPESEQIWLILSSWPNTVSAEPIIHLLLNNHTIACAHFMPIGCSSYRWKGAIETAPEHQLYIKTRAGHVQAVIQALHAHHPYQVPEILAWPIAQGLPAYTQYILSETSPHRE